MSFEQFQNSARLYVIGALEPEELQVFESARKLYGTAAEDFIHQCYALHEAFALSLKPATASSAIKDKLMAMVRDRQGLSGGGPG
ncbi:MAG TPA: hypothetical protein VH170_03665 [Chthoniobacterales bacterium]|jgi:hypothetical protein|nr:hypothetical protein [Chthoniobacterales bacterium]